MEPKVKLQAPWEAYRKMIYALFAKDPDINVQSDSCTEKDGKVSFYIESQNSDRLAALQAILSNEVTMGNITLTIDFKYANKKPTTKYGQDSIEAWNVAFTGCPYFVKTVSVADPAGTPWNYAVFSRDIISYFDDNMADYCANSHKIAADVILEIMAANDIVGGNSMHVCTECPPADPSDSGAVN